MAGARWGKLIYLALNFALVLVGTILGRRVFAVFGGIGITLVLVLVHGNLPWSLFKDSFAFVAVLSLLGFALIDSGVWWSKHETSISTRIRGL